MAAIYEAGCNARLGLANGHRNRHNAAARIAAGRDLHWREGFGLRRTELRTWRKGIMTVRWRGALEAPHESSRPPCHRLNPHACHVRLGRAAPGTCLAALRLQHWLEDRRD